MGMVLTSDTRQNKSNDTLIGRANTILHELHPLGTKQVFWPFKSFVKCQVQAAEIRISKEFAMRHFKVKCKVEGLSVKSLFQM